MTDITQKQIEIAQNIDSIVNCNVPPEHDAGTIQNLKNLIIDLNEYLETLTTAEYHVGQQPLPLYHEKL